MASRSMQCRWCKAPVIYIMSWGEEVKCEPEPVKYYAVPNGPIEFILNTGDRVRGIRYSGIYGPPTGVAYLPHWRVCKKYNGRRRS